MPWLKPTHLEEGNMAVPSDYAASITARVIKAEIYLWKYIFK